MDKITRNLSTQENRDFWALAKRTAKEVRNYPKWKRIRQDTYHKYYFSN